MRTLLAAVVVVSGCLLAALALAFASGCSRSQDGLLDFEDVSIGGDFTLTDHEGAPYTMSDHDGEIRLLLFGFTHCPDFCPTALAEMTQVYEKLGDQGKGLRTLFVSVDPERDTPELLKAYLGSFQIPVTGLTGTVEEVSVVVDRYSSFFEKVPMESAALYTMDHSTRSYLIDAEGKVRYIFSYDDDADRIVHMARKLLP